MKKRQELEQYIEDHIRDILFEQGSGHGRTMYFEYIEKSNSIVYYCLGSGTIPNPTDKILAAIKCFDIDSLGEELYSGWTRNIDGKYKAIYEKDIAILNEKGFNPNDITDEAAYYMCCFHGDICAWKEEFIREALESFERED